MSKKIPLNTSQSIDGTREKLVLVYQILSLILLIKVPGQSEFLKFEDFFCNVKCQKFKTVQGDAINSQRQ